MTTYSFRNGIKIEIPDSYSKEQAVDAWLDTVWKMSLSLNPPPPGAPGKGNQDGRSVRWTEERKKQMSRTLKARHKRK
jgi:hypothetical protein